MPPPRENTRVLLDIGLNAPHASLVKNLNDSGAVLTTRKGSPNLFGALVEMTRSSLTANTFELRLPEAHFDISDVGMSVKLGLGE